MSRTPNSWWNLSSQSSNQRISLISLLIHRTLTDSKRFCSFWQNLANSLLSPLLMAASDGATSTLKNQSLKSSLNKMRALMLNSTLSLSPKDSKFTWTPWLAKPHQWLPTTWKTSSTTASWWFTTPKTASQSLLYPRVLRKLLKSWSSQANPPHLLTSPYSTLKLMKAESQATELARWKVTRSGQSWFLQPRRLLISQLSTQQIR